MLKRFLDQMSGWVASGALPKFEANDYRLAAAALLVHVCTVDGAMADSERSSLATLLSRELGLTAIETSALVDAAIGAEAGASDLSEFTDVLRASLSAADRERIVTMMWSLVAADGRNHEFEETTVDRATRLLGLQPGREPRS